MSAPAAAIQDLKIGPEATLAWLAFLIETIVTDEKRHLRRFPRRALLAIAEELRQRQATVTIARADALHQQGETTLQEAQRLCHGDRNADYGHPGDNDARIAAMARALFGWPVRTQHVAMFMILTKLSREVHRPKRDNRVDGAGYFEVLDWIHRDGRAELKPADILQGEKTS